MNEGQSLVVGGEGGGCVWGGGGGCVKVVRG